MEPILKTVAKEYSARYKDLKQLCFLFPNKRCGIFLQKYLAEEGILSEDFPHILTISEFMRMAAHKSEAGKFEQLFTLYNSYLELLQVDKDKEGNYPDFEEFRGWGEIVLSDFNTVDMNLADPNEIFKNVKDFREIATDFLTEEQKEVRREYFGVDDFNDTNSFWKNFEEASNLSSIKKNFINLWQILAPLHKIFIEKLNEKGLGSPGSIYREAALRVNEKGKELFPYNKIIAVGFNALTEAERLIFKKLKQERKKENEAFIDFIWDIYGPLLKDKQISASKFVNFNRKNFPMPEWFEDLVEKMDSDNYPDIDVVSAPSNTSQAKVAGEILQAYTEEDGIRLIKESEVALVLPDESLLPNVLFSLPDDLKDVNLTMSLSLRNSSIASFMNLMRRLYAGMRERENNGSLFFAKDIKIFFTHPFSYQLFDNKGIEDLFNYISQYHKVVVSLAEISRFLPEDSSLFSFPSKKEYSINIFQLIDSILEKLIEKLALSDSSTNQEEISHVEIYREYLKDLEESLDEFKIRMKPLAILTMADRLISSEKIGFEGEPLTGLQVMGTLETRCLDFKHVIILSMNEGIMPRRAFTSTFIPESLRKVYGLPPARYSEEIFGYYFYRLISRAEKVTLIYDGRAISGLRGGVSRYILQLQEYMPKYKILSTNWQYNIQNNELVSSSLEKTEEIRKLIESFSSENNDKKNLSASSLNTYRECGVKFFLQSVLNINSDPLPGDYMDAISIGNILHEVMMEIYMPKELQRKFLKYPVTIGESKIEEILGNEKALLEVIENKIRSLYYRSEENEKRKLSGTVAIIATQLLELVKTMVEYDKQYAPFKLYGCEITRNFRIKLSNGREVNFRFAIDRLDEIEIDGELHMRIVDYKTGAKKLAADSLEEVFEGGYESSQIFQLFTYGWLLDKLGIENNRKVMLEIYSVPIINKGEHGYPVLGKEDVKFYQLYSDEFNTRMEGLIESIFADPCFEQSASERECEMCNFRNFCGR